MSKDIHKWLLTGCLITLTGCCSAPGFLPRSKLRQTQLSALEAHNQAKMLGGELAQSQQMYSQLASEKAMTDAHAAELEQRLSVANERLNNLAAERSRLHDEYKNLLTNMPAPGAQGISKDYEALLRRFPQLEFDPISGASRFKSEVLFESGSNQLTPEGHKVLQQFAQIINDQDARHFNVLVVGHTDDEAVVKPQTRALHETNWELSAHRATAVVRQLAKIGVSEPRMGVAGYNKFQPTAPNTSSGNKSMNRRVELFVLAPDSSIAKRDQNLSMK